MSDTYHHFAFYFCLMPEIFHNKKFKRKRCKVFNAIKCQLFLILGSRIRDDFYFFFVYMQFQIFLQDMFYKKQPSSFKNMHHNNRFWRIIGFFLLLPSPSLFKIFLLKDNCFTEFCFLSNLNMNQSQVYIYPLPFEPPSPSHPSRLIQSCLRFLSHTANSHWLSILHMVM